MGWSLVLIVFSFQFLFLREGNICSIFALSGYYPSYATFTTLFVLSLITRCGVVLLCVCTVLMLSWSTFSGRRKFTDVYLHLYNVLSLAVNVVCVLSYFIF